MNREYLINSITKISGLIIVFSFFSGWVYNKAYFDSFGIGLSILDIPIEHYFSSSFFIITDIKTIILLGSLIIYFLITYTSKKRQHILIFFDIAFILSLFVFIFFLSLSDGNHIADKNKLAATTRLSQVEIKTNKKLNMPDNLRLLHMTKERCIFIQPLKNENEQLNIFVSKFDDIDYLRIIK